MSLHTRIPELQTSHRETSDTYHGVITHLCARHRVIACKDGLQWILQQRKKGGAERPWRGVGYFRTREALVRVSATLCGRIGPSALAILAALPDVIGRSA
jgi:hypothetical protein